MVFSESQTPRIHIEKPTATAVKTPLARIHIEKPTATAVKPVKAMCIGNPTLARSKSKNKTLAVGEYVHSEVTRIQSELKTRNHDETMRAILNLLADNNLLQ